MLDVFKLIGALGLVFISFGILIKERSKQDLLYILGGICLEIYSVHINDRIFMILQLFFTLSALYDFLKIRPRH
ncbi:MAG: hypothetical protein J7K98_03710 [Candidatus Aenigmarchaeota archaeon]|nr:hypothetical protein [Candidatus Aenigmarchaeota archaeon]